MEQSDTTVITPVAAPVIRPEDDKRPQRQPRYHVVLWNDDDHSYDYVIQMLKDLFGHPRSKGFALATEVDKAGKVICLTTTMEHAELKRDQIKAYGRDKLVAIRRVRCPRRSNRPRSRRQRAVRRMSNLFDEIGDSDEDLREP
jgi:ATP-dependent Clp protease adaptor protein ClpS